MTPEEQRDALRDLLKSPGWAMLEARLKKMLDGALSDLLSTTEVYPLLRAQGAYQKLSALAAWPETRLEELRRQLREEV